MRTDLLVNYMIYESVKKRKLEIFEANFRRNFIHVKDVVGAFIFAIKNFNKLWKEKTEEEVYEFLSCHANNIFSEDIMTQKDSKITYIKEYEEWKYSHLSFRLKKIIQTRA